jgi:hypothetical protein
MVTDISTQTQTVLVDDTIAPVASVTNLPTELVNVLQCTAPTATDGVLDKCRNYNITINLQF